MPTVDERLERLLTEAAVEPAATNDVLGAVVRKRRQRNTRRVARNVGALVASLLVVAGSLMWLTADDATEPAVAPSNVRESVAARPTGTDTWLGAREIALAPDRGYVRGPLIQSGEYVALATYERDGTNFKVPPSRVVRIDANGRVLDDVELQGEVLSLSDGEGARWVLTHDADNVANPQYRVKRIGEDDTVGSNALPAGVAPNGAMVAGGGAVWVPVRDGVLRFDSTTGAYTGTIPLATWHPRTVVVLGGDAYTFQDRELVRLDPARLEAAATVPSDVRLLDVAQIDGDAWALTQAGTRGVLVPIDVRTGATDADRARRLPRGFTPLGVDALGSHVWIGGRQGERRALVRVDIGSDGQAAVAAPVALRAPDTSDVLVVRGDDVLVAADGRLVRVDLGS